MCVFGFCFGIAPGSDILAAYPPQTESNPPDYTQLTGLSFTALSGTSMACPHIAGLTALLKAVHPDWSPSMIKSAIMTTAHQNVLKEDEETLADPFDMGSGFPQMSTQSFVHHSYICARILIDR